MKAFEVIQATIKNHINQEKPGRPMYDATLMVIDYPDKSIKDFLDDEEEHQTKRFMDELLKKGCSVNEVIYTDSNGHIMFNNALGMKFAFYLDPSAGIQHMSEVPEEQLRPAFNKLFNLK